MRIPFLLASSIALAGSVSAEEPNTPAPASAVTDALAPVAAPAQAAPVEAPRKKRKARQEVKETDGSVAAGRFEAQTILKSQYHLNGQQLEVDPD